MAHPPPPDPVAFAAFEQAGWEAAATTYADAFERFTTQAIQPLLDALAAGPGVRLLDVACGPGWLAAAAAERGASVVGIDFAASVVTEARRRHPSLDIRQGNAEELAFGAGEFDAVAMSFGLLHLARPEQALRAAYRVLRPSGRLGFTVWAPHDEAMVFNIVQSAIERHGKIDVGLPVGPPFYRFSDPEECRRALLEAGFAKPTVTKIPMAWRLPSAEQFFQTMLEGTVRTRGVLQAQTPEALAAIRSAVIDAATAYRTTDGVEIPAPAVLASATRP
jgi:ubiquinone/menaquinone biosynthesis C-methylase UbiE